MWIVAGIAVISDRDLVPQAASRQDMSQLIAIAAVPSPGESDRSFMSKLEAEIVVNQPARRRGYMEHSARC
jgi:hypothetical protein